MPSAEALCLTARKRAKGTPLLQSEVQYYLTLLDDTRTTPDPDDPPSYDWTGGAPLAGGSEMQVCEEATRTLRQCGGQALEATLITRLHAAHTAAEREAVMQLGFDLLGCRHPFVLERIHDDDAAIRASVLRTFAPLEWRNHENLDLLAPFLADNDNAVAQQACELMHKTGTWLKPQAAEKVSPGLLDSALHLLHDAAPGDAPLRLDCVAYAALLTDRWDTLALTLLQRPAQDVARVVNLPCFTAACVPALLSAQPALHDAVRAAIYARFNAAKAGWRYHELSLVCCFAPDPQALELGISELAIRASAGMEMAAFVKHDPGLMPRLLHTALACVRRAQVDAFGVKSLFLAHLQAFALALTGMAGDGTETLKKIRDVLHELPSYSEGDMHMTALMGEIDRLHAGDEPQRG